MTDSLFSPSQLAKIVADTLPADSKPGDRVVVGTVDKDGILAVASFRKGDANGIGHEWELQVAYRHEWSGDDQAAARVLFKW